MYGHWTEGSITVAIESQLKNKLREAQAEIERLNEYDQGWGARIDALEKQVEGYSVTHFDLNARMDTINDMRSRASLLLSNRIDALEEQAAELKGLPERRVSQRRAGSAGRRRLNGDRRVKT